MSWVDPRFRLISASLAAILVAGAVVLFVRRPDPAPVNIVNPPAPTATSASEIKVYITGAVARPGVYPLYRGARVEDAIQAAGGPSEEADLDAVNLAKRLSDEQQIHVPARGEQAQPSALTPVASSDRVNVNTATATELETLPGIGPSLAGAIVDHREKNGPFHSVDDLESVRGIGPKLLERIRDLVTID